MYQEIPQRPIAIFILGILILGGFAYMYLADGVSLFSFELPVFASGGSCGVSSKYPDKILRWCGTITSNARKNKLDPNLVAAVILVESGGKPDAISFQGAVGLMQVMPSDGIARQFKCPNGPCFANRPPTRKLLNPSFNVEYGSNMLGNLVSKKGLRGGLASYGPSGPSSAGYVAKVLKVYNQYR